MVQLASDELAPSIGNNPAILQGVSAISWSVKREVKKNYGLGGNLSSRGFGNRVCEAKITMDYHTQDMLRNGSSSLMDLGQFDLIVSFANPICALDPENLTPGDDSTAWTTQVVKIKGCVFTEDGMDTKVDDENIEKEFDLNPLDIEFVSAGGGGGGEG